MKTLKNIISTLLMLITISITAQQGINYKALIKDGGGNVVANDLIVVQFQILQGVGMTNVYQETHSPNTDANGIVIINIGEGAVDNGIYADIDWGSDEHFLNVQINTGGGLTDMGTTQFMAVPYAKSANTMPADARIGDITVTSADVVTIVGDNTIVGEIIDIRATNVVTDLNDLMNMDMPSGSSPDAQFIEARNGGVVQFQVQGDGRTLINATTTAPQLNTVYGNSMPIAYGSVALGFNDIQTGYGISSFANPAIGEYDIVIDHATDMNNCIVLLTPYTGAFGSPEIMGYEPTGIKSFKVRIQTPAGVAKNSAFTFVVYGNH